MCEGRGGRPGLRVPNGPYGLCDRKATLKNRAQELCESLGGRAGLHVPNSPYGLCGRQATLKDTVKRVTLGSSNAEMCPERYWRGPRSQETGKLHLRENCAV